MKRAIQLVMVVTCCGSLLLGGSARAASPNFSSAPGTFLLRGSMVSAATVVMTGAFSVGHARNLDWDLPLPRSLRLNSYDEEVQQVRYHFDIRPTWGRTLRVDGHLVRCYHWRRPPANRVIHVTETVRLTVRASLSPFHSGARYPLRRPGAALAPYLRITQPLRLSSRQRAFLRQFTRGRRSEESVVVAVADWVASHTRYSPTPGTVPYDAAWVLSHHQATCQGYDNLMAAMLRYLGIPVQIEVGWASARPLWVPGPSRSAAMVQWATPGSSGELHAWLHIYFPGAGWVPFDPQREKFFVDTRHFAFLTNVDAADLQLGTWSADPWGGPSAVGRSLSDGYAEILPGYSPGSRVTVSSRDRVRVAFAQVEHDVKGVLLLSR